MSNGNFQHETDDELLSAFIDGELSDAERAAVEARLATDPDAQQLVHQLRSVSQSVQRLPLESVGRDLSEAILRRAAALKPTPSAHSSSSGLPKADDSVATAGLFHSRRPWIWASLAVAAGLMIMVFQRGAENEKLPAVAQSRGRSTPGEAERGPQEKDGAPLGVFRKEVSPQMATDPLPVAKSEAAPPSESMDDPAAAPATSPAPKSPADQAAVPSDSRFGYGVAVDRLEENRQVTLGARPLPASPSPMRSDAPANDEIRNGVAAQGAMPVPPAGDVSRIATPAEMAPPPPAPAASAAGATAPAPSGVALKRSERLADGNERQLAPTKLAAEPQAGGRIGGVGGGSFGLGGESDASRMLREQRNPPLVVHVVAKAASFEKKSFDTLLFNCGVAVEPQQPEAAKELSLRAGFSREAGERETLGRAAKTSGGPVSGGADVDFVLVEAPAATIVSCLSDLQNDAVNFVSLEVEQPNSAKDRAAGTSARDKSLASDFDKYNRGTVAPQQKLELNRFYSYFDVAGKEAADAGLEEKVRLESAAGEKPPVEAPAEDAKKSTSMARGAMSGRARRLSRLELEGEKLAAAAPAGAAASPPAADTSKAYRRAGAAGDKAAEPVAAGENLHVLFVICPEQPVAAATSTPAAEASPPPQKASK
jgi:anti-sigma factor RsiW